MLLDLTKSSLSWSIRETSSAEMQLQPHRTLPPHPLDSLTHYFI